MYNFIFVEDMSLDEFAPIYSYFFIDVKQEHTMILCNVRMCYHHSSIHEKGTTITILT